LQAIAGLRLELPLEALRPRIVALREQGSKAEEAAPAERDSALKLPLALGDERREPRAVPLDLLG
jgi:hypothetical protein